MVTYYIVSLKNSHSHDGFSALGHEIHLSRWVLLDMLNKKYIDTCVDVVVTNHEDRRFLYTKLFDHVITSDELDARKNPNDTIIELWPFMVGLPEEVNERYVKEIENKCSYPIRKLLFGTFIKDYNHLVNRIDYPEIQPISNKFFVVHLRMLYKVCHHLDVEKNIAEFYQIVTSICTKYPEHDIVVFTVSTGLELEKFKNKIKIINKLDVYASYMNHTNCEAVISPISGGGELAQYCHHNLIHLYPSDYTGGGVDFTHYLSNDRYHKLWQVRKTTDAILNHHPSLSECLEKL
jgi:hypothetical protein